MLTQGTPAGPADEAAELDFEEITIETAPSKLQSSFNTIRAQFQSIEHLTGVEQYPVNTRVPSVTQQTIGDAFDSIVGNLNQVILKLGGKRIVV